MRPQDQDPDGPDYIAPKRLAYRLGISRRTLWRWVQKGKLPAPHLRVNRKVVRWALADLCKLFPHLQGAA